MTAGRYSPVRAVSAARFQDGRRQPHDDEVAVEVPVALVYNGVSHAVMLATPADLADFALGFSLSEGIIDAPGECDLVEIREGDDGVAIQMAIPGHCFERLQHRARSLPGASGCGLCGSESLAEVMRAPPPVRAPDVSPAIIATALEALHAAQPLNGRCHGLHAAGFATVSGELCAVREDVGRHNALDKLIGAMRQAHAVLPDGVVVATSRASYEMVRKTAAAGIGMLVAISAPTSLAIDLANRAGLTLVAFARGEVMNVYAGRLSEHRTAG